MQRSNFSYIYMILNYFLSCNEHLTSLKARYQRERADSVLALDDWAAAPYQFIDMLATIEFRRQLTIEIATEGELNVRDSG